MAQLVERSLSIVPRNMRKVLGSIPSPSMSSRARVVPITFLPTFFPYFLWGEEGVAALCFSPRQGLDGPDRAVICQARFCFALLGLENDAVWGAELQRAILFQGSFTLSQF